MSFGRLGTFGTGFGRLGHAPRTPWWLAGSSLDMDFAKNRARQAGRFYAPSALLTTTRASTAYADNAAGVWSSFASNVPRITDKGLRVEEARTNSIRNNSMQGAVAGTPGTAPTNWSVSATGLTVQLVGTGTENGIDYIEYAFGGTTGATFGLINFETTTAIAATTAQVWTESQFVSITNTTNISSVQLYISERTAAGAFVQNDVSTIAPTSAFTRYNFVQTLSGGGTVGAAQPGLLFNWSNGVAVNFTVRIGWPQLELGAFVTSPIRTTSAAATRAADVIVGPALTVGSALSLYMEMTAGGSTSVQAGAQVDDGTSTNRVFLWRNNTTPSGSVRNTTDTAAMTSGTLAAGASGKFAIAAATDDAAFVFNGGTVQTDATVTFPPGLNRLSLGQNGGGFPSLNGYIRRIAYFPARLTNAQLQALTQ